MGIQDRDYYWKDRDIDGSRILQDDAFYSPEVETHNPEKGRGAWNMARLVVGSADLGHVQRQGMTAIAAYQSTSNQPYKAFNIIYIVYFSKAQKIGR